MTSAGEVTQFLRERRLISARQRWGIKHERIFSLKEIFHLFESNLYLLAYRETQRFGTILNDQEREIMKRSMQLVQSSVEINGVSL